MPGFILTLVIAAIVGWAGDTLIKGGMPAGFGGALLAGLIGAWIGAYMPFFSNSRPFFAGISIIPAIVGAVIFVFLLGLFKSAVKQT